MSITDELRNWMENAFTYKSVDGDMFHKVNTPWFGWKQDIEEMLDRIDATYEEDVNTACKLANALSADELNERGWIFATDENMAEHGWVRLPLDADGVPIHVGDVVTMQLLFGGESKPLVVDRMELSHGRDGDLWCVALDTDKECWNQPSLMRHYTPPTVEDVLRDFAYELSKRQNAPETFDPSELYAEYAAKLRLAEREDS